MTYQLPYVVHGTGVLCRTRAMPMSPCVWVLRGCPSLITGH